MHRFAMDQGWTRVHSLLIVLVFWNHAAGQKSWPSQNIQPPSGLAAGAFGSPGVQSSMLEAPVTASIPSEEVASNVFIGESLSSNYESMSLTQSLPSSLVQLQERQTSDSIASQLQGLSSPSVQDVAVQPYSGLGSYSYAFSSPDGSGLQGLSAQLASTSTGESSGVLSVPSQGSSSSFTSDSLSKLSFSPFGVSSPSSQSSSALQLGGNPSQSSSSAGSSASSLRRVSGQLFSPGAAGLFSQSQSISSQKTPGSSLYTALAASPPSVSQSTSTSQSQIGSQLADSNQYVPAPSSAQVSFAAKVPVSSQATLSGSPSLSLSPQKWQPSRAQGYTVSSPSMLQGSGSSQSSSLTQSRFSSLSFPSISGGSSIPSQGTSSLYAPAFHAKVPVISQGAPSGSLSSSLVSQWKPSSSSWSSSSQTSGAVALQSSSGSQGSKVPTSFSTTTSAADPAQFALPQRGSARYSVWSSQSQSTSSQSTPVSSTYAKLAASPLVSQSTSSQDSYTPYPSSFPSWVGSQLTASSQYSPVQGSSSYSSAIQPQSSTSQNVPTSFAAKVPLSSQATPSGFPLSQNQYSQKWQPSRSQGIPGLSTAVSQGFPMSSTSQSSSLAPSRFSVLSSAGSLIAADSSSLQSQGTSGLYAPAPLNVKVPAYSPAAPSGSLSQWKPSSSWSSNFQTSGTVASQSSSGSQGSKVPSGFCTITSAANPVQFGLPQKGSGWSSQSQSALSQNTPVSSAYAKLAASPLVSQSTSSQGSYSQYPSSSKSWVGSQLAASSQYMPVQGSSSYTSAIQPQSSTSQNIPTSSAAKVPLSSQATPSAFPLSQNQYSQKWQPSRNQGIPVLSTAVSQGLPTSGTSQSSSLAPSRVSVLSSAGSLIAADSSSLQSQGTSGLYAPAPLNVKVPAYSSAAPSGSLSQWKPSSSSWSSNFQTSGTVASQSSSGSQGSKVPSGFSTITSAANPVQFGLPQKGSGWSSQSQSALSQNTPVSSAYAKLAASPLVSQSTSSQGSYSQYPSSSKSWVGSQLAASSQYMPVQGSSSYTSAIQPQSSTSQNIPTSSAAKVPLSSQATPSAFPLSQNQYSQKWQPSRNQGIPGLSTAVSQGLPTSGTSQSSSLAPSRVSVLSSAGSLIAADSSSLQSQGTSGLYTPAPLNVKVPAYSPAAPSGSLSQWKPSSSSWSSINFQTSGTVASQSSSGSQGSKVPSGFSTITSAANPVQFGLPQKGSSWSSQSQSASSQNTPVSSAYAKLAASPLVSQSTSGHGSYSQYISSSQSLVGSPLAGYNQFVPVQASSSYSSAIQPQTSTNQYAPTSFAAKVPLSAQVSSGTVSKSSMLSQSLSDQNTQRRAGFLVAASSRYVPVNAASTFTDGSSVQLQGSSGPYAPAALDVKLPVYSQTAPSGLLPLGQQSQLQSSSSSWSPGFQPSGTVALQSSSSPGSNAPSWISSLSLAASPGLVLSPQGSSSTQSSSKSSFLPSLSSPVAQSSFSSSQKTPSISSVVFRPSKLSQAASGPAVSSQISPGLVSSVQGPTESMALSLGSNVQAVSQGDVSGQSGNAMSVFSSAFGPVSDQKAVDSKPSRPYIESVKG